MLVGAGNEKTLDAKLGEFPPQERQTLAAITPVVKGRRACHVTAQRQKLLGEIVGDRIRNKGGPGARILAFGRGDDAGDQLPRARHIVGGTGGREQGLQPAVPAIAGARRFPLLVHARASPCRPS